MTDDNVTAKIKEGGPGMYQGCGSFAPVLLPMLISRTFDFTSTPGSVASKAKIRLRTRGTKPKRTNGVEHAHQWSDRIRQDFERRFSRRVGVELISRPMACVPRVYTNAAGKFEFPKMQTGNYRCAFLRLYRSDFQVTASPLTVQQKSMTSSLIAFPQWVRRTTCLRRHSCSRS